MVETIAASNPERHQAKPVRYLISHLEVTHILTYFESQLIGARLAGNAKTKAEIEQVIYN